jgi:hypothetical protein
MPADDRSAINPREDRRTRDLELLSDFHEEGQPGWTRRAYSREYVAARQWLQQQMEDAGLRTEVDAAAHLIGHLPGRRDDLDPIVIGSHIDTVSGSGRFDGTIGVLAGIEIVRCLGESGLTLEHPIEIIDFFAAEPGEWAEWDIGELDELDRADRHVPGAQQGREQPRPEAWTEPAGLLLVQLQATYSGIPSRRPARWERGHPGRFVRPNPSPHIHPGRFVVSLRPLSRQGQLFVHERHASWASRSSASTPASPPASAYATTKSGSSWTETAPSSGR